MPYLFCSKSEPLIPTKCSCHIRYIFLSIHNYRLSSSVKGSWINGLTLALNVVWLCSASREAGVPAVGKTTAAFLLARIDNYG